MLFCQSLPENADLSELWEEVQKMGMPTLDYSTPLHTFSSGNLSYTATKECYLVGDSKCGDPGQLKINGFQIFESFAHHGSSGYTYDNSSFIFLKLTAGDIVTVSSTANGLHVYDKK